MFESAKPTPHFQSKFINREGKMMHTPFINDRTFIAFLLNLLNVKIQGNTITDDDWLILAREMEARGFHPEEFFREENYT